MVIQIAVSLGGGTLMSSVRTGWIIGGAILVLLVSVSTVYTGRGTHSANTAAQSQPQR